MNDGVTSCEGSGAHPDPFEVLQNSHHRLWGAKIPTQFAGLHGQLPNKLTRSDCPQNGKTTTVTQGGETDEPLPMGKLHFPIGAWHWNACPAVCFLASHPPHTPPQPPHPNTHPHTPAAPRSPPTHPRHGSSMRVPSGRALKRIQRCGAWSSSRR